MIMPFGVDCYALADTCLAQSVYRIWSVSLHPFQNTRKAKQKMGWPSEISARHLAAKTEFLGYTPGSVDFVTIGAVA